MSKSEWVLVAILVAVGSLIIWLIVVNGHMEDDCHKHGGVWLSHEGACVAPLHEGAS